MLKMKLLKKIEKYMFIPYQIFTFYKIHTNPQTMYSIHKLSW